ncbi:hypothetical protein MP478_04555 [Chryseobacterium sp. WG14]|uniref:hypothetical protein n=1 Tax=Chryseobacterium sp. WG14 TaxID=2926909 RepID=UPI00211DB64D|nr:hypothetical protein [Chryseobacterium sp. WG14]MCQ9638651.1 hypothetical protein [Chryseobacterium sp. WG14]
MDKRDELLAEVLNLIEKNSLTAYEISKGTGISDVGIQKIINGESKRPLERTLISIISYISNRNQLVHERVENNERNIKDLPHGEQMELLNAKLEYLIKSEDLNRVFIKTVMAHMNLKLDMFESKENELEQMKKTVN